ncbi:MAG: hypothetical protein WCI27_00805 [Candidatus Omnitrophota bacterium]
MKYFRLVHVVLAGIFLLMPPAWAKDEVLPSDIFTAILLKALQYDRNIDRHAREKMVIGIVYAEGDAPGRVFAEEVNAHIDRVRASSGFKDKPLSGVVLGLGGVFGRDGFKHWLARNNISVLVVAVNDPVFIPDLFDMTWLKEINSVCYTRECMKRGAGLGIILRDSKPRMLINIGSVKREGSDYSGKFLALCEVVP